MWGWGDNAAFLSSAAVCEIVVPGLPFLLCVLLSQLLTRTRSRWRI